MKSQKILTKNAAFQKFVVLKTNRNKRHKYNEFLVEGVRGINEAINSGWQIKSLIYSIDRQLSSWADEILKTTQSTINYGLTSSLMSELSNKSDTSELLAIVGMRDENAKKTEYCENPIIVLFDRPSNKGNLGTLLRSCDALGVDELLITGHSVDIYDPDVISSSMGSFFRVPFIRLSGNSEIEEYISKMKTVFPKFKVIGTTSHRQTSIYNTDLSVPVLFLIGNETDGLNHHLSQICDLSVTIPMSALSSASSLNVSCAATVMFYEALRQRSMKTSH